jgi:probable HAF family extracellular repeat protein
MPFGALLKDTWLALSLTMICQAALAQAMYRMTEIEPPPGVNSDGTTDGHDMNASGQIVGQWFDTNYNFRCYIWNNNGGPAQDLGTLGGSQCVQFGFSASGQATGWSDLASGVSRAFLWKNDGTPMLGLGSLATIRFQSIGFGVNDNGQVTGKSALPLIVTHGFLWRNDGSKMLDLGSFQTSPHSSSAGEAINAAGQVTGISSLDNYYRAGTRWVREQHAIVWTNANTGLQDLGTLGGSYSVGLLINDAGQIAGNSTTAHDDATHAFLWKNNGTPMTNLGTLGGTNSSVNAMNAAGQVTGESDEAGNTAQHAFLWRNNGTKMLDLGSLGGTYSTGYALNAAGQVVGWSTLADNTTYHVFVWRNDGTPLQDLNALIDPLDPLRADVTLQYGIAINDAGQILATGINNRTGLSHAYFLQGTVLTLAPRSLAFGNQPLNTVSAAKPVTVTNTGAKAAAITSVALTGAAAGQFTQTNNCGKSLAGHATCTIALTFKPTSQGAKTATLSVNGGGGGLRVVNLSGTGT